MCFKVKSFISNQTKIYFLLRETSFYMAKNDTLKFNTGVMLNFTNEVKKKLKKIWCCMKIQN